MILAPLLLTAQADMAAGETRARNEAAAAALHRQLDANHDGYVSYAEMQAAASAMVRPQGSSLAPAVDDRLARSQFDAADTDHDGRLSLAEVVNGADRTFAEADTDHDGLLSAQERGAYAARALAALQAEMARWKPLPCHRGAACDTALPEPVPRGSALDRP